MKIQVEIREEDARLIGILLEAFGTDEESGTHGALDIETLTRMLLQDVALSVRRPGSWEGANMWQVLLSHGYTVRAASESRP